MFVWKLYHCKLPEYIKSSNDSSRNVYYLIFSIFSTETYIEDVSIVILGTTNQSSRFTFNGVGNAQFGYDSTNKRYYVQPNTASCTYTAYDSKLTVNGLNFSEFKMSVDFQSIRRNNCWIDWKIGLEYGNWHMSCQTAKTNESGSWLHCFDNNNDNNSIVNKTIPLLAENTEYHLEITITSSLITMELYNENTLIDSVQFQNTVSDNAVKLLFTSINAGLHFKNLKILEL